MKMTHHEARAAWTRYTLGCEERGEVQEHEDVFAWGEANGVELTSCESTNHTTCEGGPWVCPFCDKFLCGMEGGADFVGCDDCWAKEPDLEAVTIKIYRASNGGYLYDIYDCDAIDLAQQMEDEPESDDGGLCTGTFKDAIGMAAGHAESLIERYKRS